MMWSRFNYYGKTDILTVTLQEILDDVDSYGKLECTIYGKYKVHIEKDEKTPWQKLPIYNWGH